MTAIKQRRIAAGLTQQRLAYLVGCSINMIRIVEGGYQPTREMGVRIHLALEDAEGPDPAASAAWANARQAIKDAGGLWTVAEIANRLGVTRQRIYQRVEHGTFPEPALSEPVKLWLGTQIEGLMPPR